MTRHKKKKTSDTLVMRKITIDLEETDDEPAPSPCPKSGQKKRGSDPKHPRSKADLPERPELETNNDVAPIEPSQGGRALIRQEIREWRITYRTPEEKQQKKEVLRLLEKTAGILSKMGDQEAIKEFLQHLRLHDPGAVDQIESHRNTISDLLAPSSFYTPERQPTEVPGTIACYDQFWPFRADQNRLYILRPVEVFQGIGGRYNRDKVAGFVMHLNGNFPLMCALPGCSEEHPNVLNAELWHDLVNSWADKYNWAFVASFYDQGEDGKAASTHCEPRLAVWFALFMVQELFGCKGSYKFLLGEVWRLQTLNKKLQAVMYLSEEPCPPCKEFLKHFEMVHGISFEIRVMDNLGRLKAKRDKHGAKKYSNQATDSEDSSFEEERVRMKGREGREKRKQQQAEQKQSEKQRQRCEVVIPIIATPPSSAKAKAKHSFSITKPTNHQAMRIRKFQCQSDKASAGNEANGNLDSDESDYETSMVRRRRPRHRSKTPNPNGYEDEPISPDESPFGAEARRQAKLIRREKKRKARLEMEEPSPTVGKNSRDIKFS